MSPINKNRPMRTRTPRCSHSRSTNANSLFWYCQIGSYLISWSTSQAAGMVSRAYFFTVLAALSALSPDLCAQPQNVASAPLTVLPVQGNIYAIFGPGGNITVQAGKDGVLLVDTMFEELAPRIAAEIKKLTDRPIRYIIDTHFHPDHVGGNA